MIHVGIWLSEKKWKEMGESIVDYLNSNIIDGMRIIAKRIKNKQDILIHYDLIVHKVNDMFYQTKEDPNSLTMYDLLWYMKEYPETLILDSIGYLHLLLDRHLLYSTLSNSLPFTSSIKLPKHAHLQTINDIDDLNIPFPIICKSIESCSTYSSHMMTICYHPDSLYNLKFPIFVQKFIPHDFIYKIFLVGPKIFIVKRPFITIPNDKESIFNSQNLPKIDTLISNMKNSNEIQTFSIHLQKLLGIDLLGYDLISNLDEPDIYYLVDVNYFPSYHGVPNRIEELCQFITTRIARHQRYY